MIPVLTAISNDKDYAKIFVDQLAFTNQGTWLWLFRPAAIAH